MKNQNEYGPLDKKMEGEKNNATKFFANAAKATAAEINKGGDPRSRNYMNREDAGSEGPDFNKTSKNADGSTSQNAGVFK